MKLHEQQQREGVGGGVPLLCLTHKLIQIYRQKYFIRVVQPGQSIDAALCQQKHWHSKKSLHAQAVQCMCTMVVHRMDKTSQSIAGWVVMSSTGVNSNNSQIYTAIFSFTILGLYNVLESYCATVSREHSNCGEINLQYCNAVGVYPINNHCNNQSQSLHARGEECNTNCWSLTS